MTHAEIAFAVIVGFVSAIGLIVSGIVTARATESAAELSARSMERQIALNSTGKIAEFRQAWINTLRDTMATFIAQGADLEHSTARGMIEAGTRIQLLMNRRDERYAGLTKGMGELIEAATKNDRKYNPNQFVGLCQDILKNEWEVLKKELLQVRPIP